ncbi:hypothetical protein SNL152K_4866 [Streptomyces sp. NL15-2K]|nr:hypothetical protein SNL152K_4866 [Streptomyces sp. NL15-2K]
MPRQATFALQGAASGACSGGPPSGGVPAGRLRRWTGRTWAFGRCGEWGHLPRL